MAPSRKRTGVVSALTQVGEQVPRAEVRRLPNAAALLGRMCRGLSVLQHLANLECTRPRFAGSSLRTCRAGSTC